MDERYPENGNDRRAAQDYQIELPVELEGGTGITSSVSTSRVVFKSDRSFVVGAPIGFYLSVKPPGESTAYRLYGEGTVMSVERCGELWMTIVDALTFQFTTGK